MANALLYYLIFINVVTFLVYGIDKWKESQPGCLSMFMNVLWFFVGGIWICLTHIFYGLLLCITIIGIPWGKMHFRLAKLALSPFGMEVI